MSRAAAVAARVRGRGKLPVLRSQVHQLELPLEGDPATGWRPHHLFAGSTRAVGALRCHVSVLEPGHSPHAPHRHLDEELLAVLDGEARLLVEDEEWTAGRGTFAYYPSGCAHTIRNASDRPVTYAMLKWTSLTPERGDVLDRRLVEIAPAAVADRFAVEHLLAGRTRHLADMRIHATTLLPGAGYAPHRDPYDVALLVLEGTVSTLGREVGPSGIVYYARGEPHGMRNVGADPALYLVVELRSRRPLLPRRRPR